MFYKYTWDIPLEKISLALNREFRDFILIYTLFEYTLLSIFEIYYGKKLIEDNEKKNFVTSLK